jgi:hypothetical protein
VSPYPQHKGLQQDYLSNLAAAESMPAKNKVTKEKLQEQKRVGGRRSRNEVSAVNQDLHAQIMASLQVRKESPPEVHDEQHGDTPEQEELAEPTRPKGPSDEVEEKLHGLVKVELMIICMKHDTDILPRLWLVIFKPRNRPFTEGRMPIARTASIPLGRLSDATYMKGSS